MSQGMTPVSIDNISHTDYSDLVIAFKTGLLGPFKDYILGYNHYAMAHSNSQVALRGQDGKRFRYEKPKPLKVIYPAIYEYMTNTVFEDIQKPSLALKFARMLVTSDTPDHIKNELGKTK